MPKKNFVGRGKIFFRKESGILNCLVCRKIYLVWNRKCNVNVWNCLKEERCCAGIVLVNVAMRFVIKVCFLLIV